MLSSVTVGGAALTVSAIAQAAFVGTYPPPPPTVVTTAPPPPESSSSSGLATGALVGIIIGCIVAVLAVAGAVVFMRRRSASKIDPKCNDVPS